MGLATRVALSLGVMAGSSTSVQAQGTEPRQGPSWTLRGLRSEQCIRFLVQPDVASRSRREGLQPIRADQDSSLHPALRRVISDQPEFASWTPSAICLFYADTVALAGRTIVEKNARRPQLIVVWTLATTEQGSGARRDLVLDLGTSDPRVVRAAEAVKLRIRSAESAVTTPPDSDEVHVVKLGKTRLAWTGRAAGDSTRVEQPLEESWKLKGASGVVWNVRRILHSEWNRSLVGVLRVEGKDDLSKALKSSPIRFIGPRYLGGRAEFLFSR